MSPKGAAFGTQVAVERVATKVRLLLVLAAGSVYFLAMDPSAGWAPIAVATLSLAGAYSLILHVWAPFENHPWLITHHGLTVMDAVLVAGWVTATGAGSSPFFLIWYASLVALVFRYGRKGAYIGAGLYLLLDGAILLWDGAFVTDLAGSLVRLGFLPIFGALAGWLSEVTEEEASAKMTYLRLARRAEAANRRLHATLSLHKATLESTADGILAVDRRGKIVSYNHRFLELWGLQEDVLVAHDGRALWHHIAKQVEATDAFQDPIERLKEEPEAETYDQISLIDGRILERYSRPQTLDGEIAGRVWSFRDITATHEATAELEQRNADLRQFAYVVSHDLREPLRMVSSYVELLERRYADKLDQDAHEFIAYAVEGADRMDRLIRDLAAYARLSTDPEPMAPTDMDEVLADTLDNLAMVVEDTRATVTHDRLPVVHGDASQLTLVLQNLIANAIKFHAPGRRPRIHVSATAEAGGWHLTVADNGIGIPEDDVDSIFTVFHRLHDEAAYEGTGMGLAICRRVIDRHNGDIWVETEGLDGHGSTFHLRLPAPPDQAAAPPRPGTGTAVTDHHPLQQP